MFAHSINSFLYAFRMFGFFRLYPLQHYIQVFLGQKSTNVLLHVLQHKMMQLYIELLLTYSFNTWYIILKTNYFINRSISRECCNTIPCLINELQNNFSFSQIM